MSLYTDQHGARAARACREADKAAAFHFAPTFKLDLVFSAADVLLFNALWSRIEHPALVCVGAGLIGLALLACYVGKVAIDV